MLAPRAPLINARCLCQTLSTSQFSIECVPFLSKFDQLVEELSKYYCSEERWHSCQLRLRAERLKQLHLPVIRQRSPKALELLFTQGEANILKLEPRFLSESLLCHKKQIRSSL